MEAEAARTVKLSRRSVVVVADGNSKSFNAVNEVCFVLFFKRNIILNFVIVKIALQNSERKFVQQLS